MQEHDIKRIIAELESESLVNTNTDAKEAAIERLVSRTDPHDINLEEIANHFGPNDLLSGYEKIDIGMGFVCWCYYYFESKDINRAKAVVQINDCDDDEVGRLICRIAYALAKYRLSDSKISDNYSEENVKKIAEIMCMYNGFSKLFCKLDYLPEEKLFVDGYYEKLPKSENQELALVIMNLNNDRGIKYTKNDMRKDLWEII